MGQYFCGGGKHDSALETFKAGMKLLCLFDILFSKQLFVLKCPEIF